MILKKSKSLFWLLALACLLPLRAHAYLDPGTGSYVVQILIGSVLGAGYLISAYWRKIVGFFRKDKLEDKSKKKKAKK